MKKKKLKSILIREKVQKLRNYSWFAENGYRRLENTTSFTLVEGIYYQCKC